MGVLAGSRLPDERHGWQKEWGSSICGVVCERAVMGYENREVRERQLLLSLKIYITVHDLHLFMVIIYKSVECVKSDHIKTEICGDVEKWVNSS